ncbi:hypothetical protein AVEN_96533-1 [Araneus ventricosus]|uniref:Uncharacterized protein n=1 Tax=Araneus ventricosus TaxID=182803 RepID=A0A4Y2I4E5_ARAVE|nr:hypothetical protein AVEN_96533-1 [Araneus ventricosus]
MQPTISAILSDRSHATNLFAEWHCARAHENRARLLSVGYAQNFQSRSAPRLSSSHCRRNSKVRSSRSTHYCSVIEVRSFYSLPDSP